MSQAITLTLPLTANLTLTLTVITGHYWTRLLTGRESLVTDDPNAAAQNLAVSRVRARARARARVRVRVRVRVLMPHHRTSRSPSATSNLDPSPMP